MDNSYAHDAFGAHFAEVGVDRDTGEVRVRRMLGVFAAGRILNAKTARSQMIGGMIWCIGSALMEENHVDLRYGSFINQDLASYHVAVNADIGALDAVLLYEADPHGSPLGSKGLGELGICGACEQRVISGIPEHRDSILSEEEQAENTRVMICCAGCKTDRLVLDL